MSTWKTKKRACALALGLLVALLAVLPVQAQTPPDLSQLFEKRTAMVPMRDAVRLYTEIYLPRQRTEPLPFLLTRSPYGQNHDVQGFNLYLNAYRELIEDGYIFVFQDIRGRFGSEGEFVMLRPPRDPADPKAIDEGTDTYDTIAWLLANVPGNNGRAGLLGISYGGWLTVMGMLEPHPALKAVSPQASPADMFIGDDFLHNGALRLDFAFGYVAMMEGSKEFTRFAFDRYDTYEWFLELGPLANANRHHLHGQRPTWNDIMAHPNYDEYWQRQAVLPYLTRVTVPTLNVAGWWDAEDFYGPMKIYQGLEKQDTQNLNYLVVGPWRHGGWARDDGRSLGPVQFDTPTGDYFRQNIQAPWFAYWLKDKGRLELPEALTFQTGSNQWKSYSAWPPRERVEVRRLYFHPGGRLSFDPPAEDGPQAYDAYVSDPASPVPYRPRPIQPFWAGSEWPIWQVGDQRLAHGRPDVLTWQTPPLETDVEISGDVLARLFAATSGTDSDWVVKLIDVYPDDYPGQPEMGGYQLMIAGEVFRARFRNSFERPEPVVPGQVTPYALDLISRNHVFGKGHRIMVQVQSTWFPLIDRNPQTYVHPAAATEADYRPATQRIYRSQQFPSHIELPVAVR